MTPALNMDDGSPAIAKNQTTEFLYTVAYNFRRLLVLEPEIIG